jgi:hypothetical protein
MNTLESAIGILAKRGANPARERARALLDGLVRDCRAAADVWREYLAAPGAAGDIWSLVSWVGPERARRLHEINLSAKAQLLAIGRLAGPEAARFMDLDEDMIEMAYRQLAPGETGPDAARAAIERLDAKAARLPQWRAQLQGGKTASAAVKAKAGMARAKKAVLKTKPAKKKAPKTK